MHCLGVAGDLQVRTLDQIAVAVYGPCQLATVVAVTNPLQYVRVPSQSMASKKEWDA